jgi:hypothetical protein
MTLMARWLLVVAVHLRPSLHSVAVDLRGGSESSHAGHELGQPAPIEVSRTSTSTRRRSVVMMVVAVGTTTAAGAGAAAAVVPQ